MKRSENIPRFEVEDEAIVQPLRFMPAMYVQELQDFKIKQLSLKEHTARNEEDFALNETHRIKTETLLGDLQRKHYDLSRKDVRFSTQEAGFFHFKGRDGPNQTPQELLEDKA